MTRRKTVSKVLELKGFTKEQLEAEVLKIREKLNSEQQKLAALEQTYAGNCAELTACQQKGTMPVRELNLFYAYLEQLTRQMKQQKMVIAQWQAELAEKQKAMVEAYKEQRLVEILHNKIVKAEVKEADRSEQKEADSNFLTRKVKE